MKIDLLNWRPDLEDNEHDGLTTADNVIHDAEGWKKVTFVTDGAVSTLSGLDTTYLGTALSAQIRQVGTLRDATENNKVLCYLREGVTPSLVIDPLQGAGGGTAVGLTVFSSGNIKAFQVTELDNNIFVTAEASGTQAGGTSVTVNFTGYADIGA